MTKSYLRRISVAVCISVLFIGMFGLTTWATAEETEPPVHASIVEPSASSAVLENPTFDNHDWYEFNDRYGNWLTGSWLPDADNDGVPESERQDWRLWYQQGTAILEYDPEQKFADHDEGIQMRPYDWDISLAQEGGIYQVVHDTVPCLNYKFTMQAQGRPEEAGDALHGLKAGITRDGWHLPTDDPAVDSFPSSMQWGDTELHQNSYGEIAVTAEAWADHITVFAYGKSVGGRTSRILWDTGSFSEVTPDRIYDPDTYSGPTAGIFGLDASKDVSGDVLISWTTSQEAISQVYYRSVGSGTSVSPTVMSYTVYLPLVMSSQGWQATALDKTADTGHLFTLSGLADGDYEYIVVSKGTDGSSACETWVAKGTFTLP